MSVTFVSGKGQSKHLLLDGHLYSKDRIRNNNGYYKCLKRDLKCPGRVTIDIRSNGVIKQTQHNHDEDQCDVVIRGIRSTIKSVSATSDNSIRRIVAQSVDGQHDEVLSGLSSIAAICKMAGRARSLAHQHPSNPYHTPVLSNVPQQREHATVGQWGLCWHSQVYPYWDREKPRYFKRISTLVRRWHVQGGTQFVLPDG